VSIAIPHIDPEHVISPGLLVCRNSASTTFHAMDDPERNLDVQLSIWPLVTDPGNQIDMLEAVITLIQDESSSAARQPRGGREYTPGRPRNGRRLTVLCQGEHRDHRI